jgi:hypothetical protein
MGYNRSGDARKARLKRRKKEMERLAKAPRPAPAPTKGGAAKPTATQPVASPEPAP